ncbi:hypothetical protein [Streptomyces sp. NPDC058304]|uniref:hypothetical protein n=1 Tax=Streptomyces sp. NPDC058304 TaxID=3346437 RepID=UPI0036ED5FC6
MTTQPAAEVAPEPASLTLDLQHSIPLLGLSTTEIWQVQIRAGGSPVGSLRAVLNLCHDGSIPQSRMDISWSAGRGAERPRAQSRSPAVSAWTSRAAKTRSVPSMAHIRSRLWGALHDPNRAARSIHGVSVRYLK